MRAMTLYHATTPKKLERYKRSGFIQCPVRGFSTLAAAQWWAARVGRSIVLEIEGRDCHKLPDHHTPHGRAWWVDHDVCSWSRVA